MQKFSLLIFFFSLFLVIDCFGENILLVDSDIGGPNISSSACKGAGTNNSAIKYVVSGSPGPYMVTWRELGAGTDLGSQSLPNPTDSINITGLDGTLNYEVEVRDDMNALLCQDTFRFNTIGSLGVNTVQNDTPSCFGDSDGSATAVVLIGSQEVSNPEQQQYSFSWSSGAVTQTANNLSAGAVSVFVISPEGCTADGGFVMGEPGVLTVNPTLTSPSCPGSDDGTIRLEITGGTSSTGAFPYTIQWSTGLGDLNANPLNNSNNPITAGTYDVTVTDTKGCNVIDSYELLDPDVVSIDGFTNQVNSLCSRGVCSGEIEVQVSGGGDPSAGYNYIWNNGETSAQPVMLCAGWNVVQVSNAGCPPIIDSVLISSANDVVVNVVDSTNASCFRSTDGTIQVLANGGSSSNYTYGWNDDGSITGPNRTLLMGGTYTVSAVDDMGCMSLPRNITLSQPDSLELVVDLGGTLNPRCSDSDNGILAVRWVRGGNMSTTPTYTWSSNTPNPPNAPVATDLPPATYSITITDGNGCQDMASYTLTAPLPLQGRMSSPPNPNCFGELTAITVDGAVGGTGTSFTFSVNNGPQQPLTNPNQVLAGTHIVSVFDRNTCRWDTTIVISQPDELTVDLVDEIMVNLGDSALLIPSIPNSIPLSSTTWSPPGNLSCTNCLTPLVIPTQSAVYQLVVTDENGCVGMDQVRVTLNRTRNVYVPNAFSPNNDGINDFFQLSIGTGVNRVNYLRVFDRWGSLVYEQENYLPGGGTDGWNGELKGKDLNIGTYVYISEIEFQDATKLVYRGSFSLVR